MAQRLKLIVAYDGGPFAGWQSQPNGNAIQNHIERAIQRVSGKPVRVHGSGRTDAGVHALGQCAHFDVDQSGLSPARWLSALNALLPATIRILDCRRVSNDFHARFSAKGKVYRYRIWSAPVLPPFEYGRVCHLTNTLDLEPVKRSAKQFIGTHDFAAFAANRATPEANSVRTLHSVRVTQRGGLTILEFDGDGFLYKMARLLAGAVVQHAQGKLSIQEITRRLAGASSKKPSPLVAPAAGLFLVRVRY
jgi:tRNA pseudouridine38-40 synthase